VPRLVITSDLHYNHLKSREPAEEAIRRINREGGDILILIGDTAIGDGDSLEQCLSRFRFSGPKLLLCGNHELWTTRGDSYFLFTEELPRRVAGLGWRWLETEPFTAGDLAIVGTMGWYDYSFAQKGLGIPRRFYEHKISPGAAEKFPDEYGSLFERRDDISEHAMEVVARWNDGRFVRLGRSDEAFTDECVTRLTSHLQSASDAKRVIAAIHHVPFRALVPPPRSAQWDFTKAYLGSEKLGDALLAHANVTDAFCGHSHFPAEARVEHIRAVNTGSGYRGKVIHKLDV
jgi:hypothetical protein